MNDDSNEDWHIDDVTSNFNLNESSLPANEPNETFLPHWLVDEDLKNSETETLPLSEEQFWKDLIDKYLIPIEPGEEEKVRIYF